MIQHHQSCQTIYIIHLIIYHTFYYINKLEMNLGVDITGLVFFSIGGRFEK